VIEAARRGFAEEWARLSKERSRESAAAERKLQDARREAARLVDAVAKGEMTGRMVSAAQLGRRRHRSEHRQYGKVRICASFRTSAAQRGCGLRMPASGKLRMSGHSGNSNPSALAPRMRPFLRDAQRAARAGGLIVTCRRKSSLAKFVRAWSS